MTHDINFKRFRSLNYDDLRSNENATHAPEELRVTFFEPNSNPLSTVKLN